MISTVLVSINVNHVRHHLQRKIRDETTAIFLIGDMYHASLLQASTMTNGHEQGLYQFVQRTTLYNADPMNIVENIIQPMWSWAGPRTLELLMVEALLQARAREAEVDGITCVSILQLSIYK